MQMSWELLVKNPFIILKCCLIYFICLILGSYELKRFDPFLMLDFFKVRLPSGFPDHPHRGFETVTYMLSGSVHHEDFRGNKVLTI